MAALARGERGVLHERRQSVVRAVHCAPRMAGQAYLPRRPKEPTRNPEDPKKPRSTATAATGGSRERLPRRRGGHGERRPSGELEGRNKMEGRISMQRIRW